MTSEQTPRLITLPISHYCEKARWALDRADVRYREERHVQGIHSLMARRAGGGATVPVLVTGTGVVLGESHDILAWSDGLLPAGSRLFPEQAVERAEVERLCRRLDEVLGPSGRRLIYVHMFSQRKLALDFNDVGVPTWEDKLARGGWPLFERLISRVLGITPGCEVRDEATVFGELDHVAQLLGDGRPYLCGERFTAADLTFAALSAPVVVPREYGTPLPQPELMTPHTAALVSRAREHPAGRHALDMFARHRRARATVAGTP
ncbi:MAG: glutathione S-transferase family protein [Solirubrobacteraceae bacterium]